ncbi:NtaA/DmoA family FMN-dependent monooxygenase [Herbiconiux moechotypicola]|uniref:NtaA/DmoA family FMN-dependent monooxygenase n=1 Tax=Herbiconiux moechotypicola TaxID=637393 RepID=A0ABN3DRL2_9MICO|nr:NtaA/DmoA family FMN-dependent monooxygenase [Herbiconiux moechotypicola]MCS5731684.1 NtaA/DmoA family FMN-dependent monooxygenase [Herbiconiux moechotypicola]
MFKLGWFVDGYSPKTWYQPWSGEHRSEWAGSDFWVDIARSMERGGFDMFFMEDTAMIEDTYQGSMDVALKFALMAPKNDPMPLAPLIAQATSHIGIVPTISTMQYHPYLAARLGTTLDHLSNGRIGFNVVTSVSHRVAQNYGYDRMFEHDERYVRAEEWMDAVSRLWESWEPGAMILDTEEPRFADHTKVHPVNFEGKYYRTRGPLNSPPGPQGRPVIAQAGGSPKGRDLAARNADVMLGLVQSPEEMITFRKDMDERLISFGRKPEDLHIFYIAHAFIGATDADGQAWYDGVEAENHDPDQMEMRLWGMSYASGGEFDYSTFDLDEPMFKEIGNGETTTLKAVIDSAGDKTLREVITGHDYRGMDFIGSAKTIAGQMKEVMDATGRPDGFLIEGVQHGISRRSVAEITEGLCPELKRQKLIRKSYSGSTFRENLNDWE